MIAIVSLNKTSSAAPHSFFERWVDHATWPEWSPDTEWATLDGPVALQATGVLKPKGGPKTPFTITELETDRLYTDVSRFPGARLTFRHAVEPSDAGSALKVDVWFDGPLARIWARAVGRGLRDSVPADLDRLIALAEAR